MTVGRFLINDIFFHGFRKERSPAIQQGPRQIAPGTYLALFQIQDVSNTEQALLG